jgi:hypothetical protein
MPRFTGFGSSGKGCGCCTTTLCVTACGNVPLVGASVTIQSGGSTGPVVFSGTTGSGGCVPVPISGPGYYTTISASGSSWQGSPTYPAGGTLTIEVGSSVAICCGGYAIPTGLTLTDAAGSLALDYCSGCSGTYPTWTGGHAVQQVSCTISTPNNICIANAPSMGPVRVCYQMTCVAGQSPTFSLQRSWSWVYQQSGQTPIWFQDPTGFSPGQYCITEPPTICGNPLTDTVSGSADPSSDSPFAISFDPTSYSPDPTATADPVGGSVAISA